MGRRGPPPKPSELQKRQGTYRPDRRRGEIEPPKEMPKPPTWLSKRGRKCWREIAPWLHQNGLLTRLDQTALALLCEPLADYLAAREIVDEAAAEKGTRFVTTTDKGNIIQHPAVGVMNKAWEKVVKLLREFGMTPSARAAIHVDAEQEAENDPLTAILRERYREHGVG